MTWPTLDTQYLSERTADTVQIPLTDEDGAALVGGAVNAITATLTSDLTGTARFTARNVLSSLGATTVGTLDVVLTSDDLAMTTTREIEALTLTVSIKFDTTREAHLAVPLLLRQVVAAADLTP
jgi:hypothetical protein